MRRTRHAAIAAVTTGVLLFAACGDDGQPSATTTTPSETPAAGESPAATAPASETASPTQSTPASDPTAVPASPPASPTGAPEPAPTEDLGELSDQPRVVERSPAPTPALVAVRTGHHPTYDRVTFEFDGPLPGYRVEYVAEVHQPGSGDRVELDGNDFLHVVFEPAVGHDEQGRTTYDGPREIDTGYPSLREVELAGDFEAQVSFGMGLDDRVGFRVFELENPSRVVIDVAG